MKGIGGIFINNHTNRPAMNLAGMDGNIFGILGKAARLLRKNGQPDQAAEMTNRVFHSDSYEKALSIISEYVETELSATRQTKSKNERGEER